MQGLLVRGGDSGAWSGLGKLGVENPHVKTSELSRLNQRGKVLEARHPAEHFLLASFHLCVTIQVACTRMTGKTLSGLGAFVWN